MDIILKDKIAIITGGSQGIGKAIAEKYAEHGARTIICARNKKKLMEAAEDIKESVNADITAIPCDVSKKEDVLELVDKGVFSYQRLLTGLNHILSAKGDNGDCGCKIECGCNANCNESMLHGRPGINETGMQK